MEWTMGIIILCMVYDLINLHLSEREYGKTIERMVNSELAHPNHLRCRASRLPQVCKDVSTQSVEARQGDKVYLVEASIEPSRPEIDGRDRGDSK